MSDDLRYQLVDTNVLLYGHDTTAGRKHDVASELLRQLWRGRNGCLSVQVLQEFYVNATRLLRTADPHATAYGAVRELATWRMHCPCPTDILEAIRLHRRYHISFWDAMIINSARQLGCAVVWSEDLNSSQDYDGVVVRNPFE